MASKVSKWWLIGFICGLLIFVVIDLHLYEPHCFDCEMPLGWPLTFMKRETEYFNWISFLLDIFVALIGAALLGAVFHRIARYRQR